MAREITFRGKTVIVRQLTVGEVADFFDHAQDMTITTADILMNRQVPAQVVTTACGLTLQDDLAGDALPSELTALWDAVEAENPFFCAAMNRLAAAVKLKEDKELWQEMESGKPPASLPKQAMAPA